MKTQINIKHLLVLILSVVFLSSRAQLKSFGTSTKHIPITDYKWAAYGYYDFSREAGIGISNQLSPRWSIDFSAFYIRPNSFFKWLIKEWDYYDFNGAGISIKALNHTGTKGFYYGSTCALEYLEHKKISVEYYNGKGYDKYVDMDEAYGWAIAPGFTIGRKFLIGRVRLDPFASVNLTIAHLKRTTFSSSSRYEPVRQFPYVQNTKMGYGNLGLGLKIGFEFKKNKKNIAINEKFDKIYIPRQLEFNNYLKGVDYRRLANPKPLRRARSKIKGANKYFVKVYRSHYRDTTAMYNKIESYYQEIDSLIEQGKK